MPERLEKIYQTPQQDQAQLLQSLLEDYGIGSQITGGISAGGDSLEGHEGSIVLVQQEDVVVARGIVAAFEKHVVSPQQEEPSEGEVAAEENEAALIWRDWPTCPVCRQRRQVSCPICQAAGIDFELGDTGADRLEVVEPDDVLLICPDCDEPNPPSFYRQCVWCDHDFGDGTELLAAATLRSNEWTARPIAVAIGLLSFALIAFAYFWHLVAARSS